MKSTLAVVVSRPVARGCETDRRPHAFAAEFDANKPVTLTGTGHEGRLEEPAA